MSLYSDFLCNQKRTIHKWVHYFPAYERHFKRFINQPVIFWEIGVFKGGSVQLWKRYLGPFAIIIGIDINPKCKRFEEEQIHIRIGDQSDTTFLQSLIDEFGPPDVVLDDGSHIMEHVCKTWEFMYDKISKNGVYFVEDLHTAYFEKYGGGLNREDTFIERCKCLIGDIRAKNEGAIFAESTYSISFYDSMAVFEKRPMKDYLYRMHEFVKNDGELHDLSFYDEYIGKFKNQAAIVWAVGVSATCPKVWNSYLGKFSTVIGINTCSNDKGCDREQVYFRNGSLADVSFLQSIVDEFGPPDIVFDEDNNLMEIESETWNYLYYGMSKNGICLIKSSCHHHNDNEKSKNETRFIERCKELLDYINARWNGLPTIYAESTYSMTHFNNATIFEKNQLTDDAISSIMVPTPFSYTVVVSLEKILVVLKKILNKLGLLGTAKKLYKKLKSG